jgi:predicted small lipoprotein YifL
MAYSVAVIRSGIYAQMQTAKVIFTLLISVSLVTACGLRGPLYLPENEPGTQVEEEQASTQSKNAEAREKDEEKDEEGGS